MFCGMHYAEHTDYRIRMKSLINQQGKIMNNERFEYMTFPIKPGIFKFSFDPALVTEDLNRLGAQGWELVTALPAMSKFGVYNLIFKRLK